MCVRPAFPTYITTLTLTVRHSHDVQELEVAVELAGRVQVGERVPKRGECDDGQLEVDALLEEDHREVPLGGGLGGGGVGGVSVRTESFIAWSVNDPHAP